jgi:hypothetical protein
VIAVEGGHMREFPAKPAVSIGDSEVKRA